MMMRVAIGPDRAGDLEIPRGAVLMIAPWVLHRHRRLWRDPDAFDRQDVMPKPVVTTQPDRAPDFIVSARAR
jgi:hypothetical protein